MAAVSTDILPLPARATPLGSHDKDLRLTLLLRPREPLPSLEALCAGGWSPLDHDALERAHGARQEDIAVVEELCQAHGLTLVDADWKARAARRGTVRISGSISAVSAAFGVTPAAYEVDGVQFVTATAPASLPDHVAPSVAAILGLSTQPVVQRAAFLRSRGAPRVGGAGAAMYSAREVAALYDYPDTTGSGQCVGLIEMSGALCRADLATYFQHFGVSPEIVVVNVNPPVPSSWDVEVTLDAELAGLAAPGARLAIYNANSETYSMQDFYSVIEAAVFDEQNRPSVLSISWAFAERIEDLDAGVLIPSSVGPAVEAPFRALFARAALLGITLCAASGDLGSQIPATSRATPTTIPTGMFPGTSPLVLSVGGTTLHAAGGRILGERVWNRLQEILVWVTSGGSLAGGGGASGGGVSAIHRRPPYQEGIGVPDMVVLSWEDGILSEQTRFAGRGIPDVAANSDFLTGYQFFYASEWGVCGGTSSSTPMWAALVARLNEALGARVGLLGPRLYSIQRASPGALRTISEGGNGGYFASGAMWNPCTGLGSPNGKALLAALSSRKAT